MANKTIKKMKVKIDACSIDELLGKWWTISRSSSLLNSGVGLHTNGFEGG